MPPAPHPRIIPMLTYEDGVAALDWLARAFGFRERTRLLGPDGRLAQGEMELGEGLILLASATRDDECPRRHREHCERARQWSSVPWVIDGFPGRRYRAEDCEGHRWMFLEPTRGAAP